MREESPCEERVRRIPRIHLQREIVRIQQRLVVLRAKLARLEQTLGLTPHSPNNAVNGSQTLILASGGQVRVAVGGGQIAAPMKGNPNDFTAMVSSSEGDLDMEDAPSSNGESDAEDSGVGSEEEVDEDSEEEEDEGDDKDDENGWTPCNVHLGAFVQW